VASRPICPELAKLLRWHTEEFGYSQDGKLLTGVKGGELPDITIRRAWTAVGAEALTEEEQATPLAKPLTRTSPQVGGSLPGRLRWGGWGSNPRPADYESAALTS
jgi:hypothetical protein